MTSATPTTISIAWDEIPCLMRNGMICRYIVLFCHVSVTNCQSFTIVTDVSNRALTYSNLIPRSSYNIAIRADSQDPPTLVLYTGSLSSPITASTAAPQGLQYFICRKCSHMILIFFKTWMSSLMVLFIHLMWHWI